MKQKHLILVLFLLVSNLSVCVAQEQILYKQIDTTQLFIDVYYPEKMDASMDYPAIVFFFGGGWINGNRNHFINHAKYFAQRGLVCFLVDYRTRSKHETTPFECLQDAKSAMRYIRKNADKFNVDKSKIIASGGSAGGHLAAATALIEGFNESNDNLSISCIPNALVLFNPVFDNGPGGYGYTRINKKYKEFSPLHNINEGAPPTIIFLGTNDNLIPVETAEYYKIVMEKVGSICELKLYEGKEHGFFNYGKPNYAKTLKEADIFLQSLGYLKDKPIIEIE